MQNQGTIRRAISEPRFHSLTSVFRSDSAYGFRQLDFSTIVLYILRYRVVLHSRDSSYEYAVRSSAQLSRIPIITRNSIDICSMLLRCLPCCSLKPALYRVAACALVQHNVQQQFVHTQQFVVCTVRSYTRNAHQGSGSVYVRTPPLALTPGYCSLYGA